MENKQKLSDEDLEYINGGMSEMAEQSLKVVYNWLKKKLDSKLGQADCAADERDIEK